MRAARHFARIDGRDVHYRRWGEGPAVLLIHGSPQSSRAVEAVAVLLAARGLCAIAPDTPGAGRSDALPGQWPKSDAYARNLAAFADALGLKRVGLYGFHTGAGTACTFAALYPERTAAVAFDGLPAWTEAERIEITARYLPPFIPSWDGAHMAWLWARIEDQSIFFPWYELDQASRMAGDLPPVASIHVNAMDFLDSDDAYRAVYQAAFDFRAEDWLPQVAAPTLIAATRRDPLHAHLSRPAVAGRGQGFEDAPAIRAACVAHLAAHPGDAAPPAPGNASRGFASSGGETVAWRRAAGEGPSRLRLHAAGDASVAPVWPGDVAIDLPGHGDSAEGWAEVPRDAEGWADALEPVIAALELGGAPAVGDGAGARIAEALARRGRLGAVEVAGAGYGPPPDARFGRVSLAAEWDGAHLVRAWRIAHWERLFRPWWRREAACALTPPGDMSPRSVHARAVNLLKAHERWTAAAALEA